MYSSLSFFLLLQLVSSLVPGSRSDPLPPLIPEDKVVFGLLVTCPLLKTIHELAKAYCSVDVSTIAREVRERDSE